MRSVYNRTEAEQRKAIGEAGREPIMSYNQTDFVKNRIAVEVQFWQVCLRCPRPYS